MRLTKHVYPSAILNFHVGWINELVKQNMRSASVAIVIAKTGALSSG